MLDNFQVLIIGGGIPGLILANILGDNGVRVGVIEQQQPNPQAVKSPNEFLNYDLRVSAITRASQNIFQSLNIWDAITAERVSPYEHMVVWDGNGSGNVQFNSAEIGEPNLGHIIENSVMQRTLLTRLKNLQTVEWLCPISITNYVIEKDCVRVELTDGRCLTAQLLVGADGGNSWVRQQANIDVTQWDYGHHALVATVFTECPHQKTAMQRFIQTEESSGTLAFLPLAHSHVCSIVWAMQPQVIKNLCGLDEEEFKQQLTRAFEYRLGNVSAVSKRVHYPLQMRHAKTYVKERLALIGDAAHTIHPLAGQGMNLGILDATCLAEVLLEAFLKNDYDLGSFKLLRKYQRWRVGHNLGAVAAMEGFKRLFASNFSPIRFLRNTGLNTVDRLPFVKSHLIRLAMGLQGDLPKRAKLFF